MQSKMPSKASTPRYKRPPSPYASQSPRVNHSKSQQAWRSPSSTGASSRDNLFVNNTREMWLKSLRQGTDQRRDPIKAVHSMNSNKSLNTSLASTSDYLREKMGMPETNGRRRRRNSVGGGQTMSTGKHGPVQYKSQEDMYDEIMQLKKNLIMQKEQHDLVKSKLRRVEEENIKKDKEIEKFLDPTKNNHVIRSIGSGKSNPIVTNLKQKQLKLEQQLKEKEQEVISLRMDVKTTDAQEMKTAMEMYYQEVVRLRTLLDNQSNQSVERHADNGRHGNTKSMRENILRLTSENHQLQSENKSLKMDLTRALDGASSEEEDENEEGDKIKYSALSQTELISMIKRMKQAQITQAEIEKHEEDEERTRLKNIISQLKEERNTLRNENNEKILDLEKLEEDNNRILEENEALRRRLKIREDEFSEYNEKIRKKNQREENIYEERREKKVEEFKQARAAKSIQKNWRQYKTQKADDAEKEESVELLQSAFKGHMYRDQQINQSRRRDKSINRIKSQSHSYSSHYNEVIDSGSDAESLPDDDAENVSMLQAAMRGHLVRNNKLTSKRPASPAKSITSSQYGSYKGSRPSSPKKTALYSNRDETASDSDSDIVIAGPYMKNR